VGSAHTTLIKNGFAAQYIQAEHMSAVKHLNNMLKEHSMLQIIAFKLEPIHESAIAH
jgi:adenosylmethionine-8-amino-7-oxononanoate aminotransferase